MSISALPRRFFSPSTGAKPAKEILSSGIAQREDILEVVYLAEVTREQGTHPRAVKEFAVRVRVADDRMPGLDQRPGCKFALHGVVSVAAQTCAHADAQVGDQVEKAVGASHTARARRTDKARLGQ